MRSLASIESNGTNSSSKLVRIEDIMSGQAFTFKFCKMSNSVIFDVTSFFTAPRDDFVFPHPHVQPVPRAKPAVLKQP